MATKQSTIDYLLEQFAGAGRITAKKMFGEYGIYRGDVMFALVCDDELHVKDTPGGRALLPAAKLRSPYPGAKPCLWVSGDLSEDRDLLAALAKTTASELPAPKKAKGAATAKQPKRPKGPADRSKPTKTAGGSKRAAKARR